MLIVLFVRLIRLLMERLDSIVSSYCTEIFETSSLVEKDFFYELNEMSPSVNDLVDASIGKGGIFHRIFMQILSYFCLDDESTKYLYRRRMDHEESKSIFSNDPSNLLAEIDALRDSLDEERDIRKGAQLLLQTDKQNMQELIDAEILKSQGYEEENQRLKELLSTQQQISHFQVEGALQQLEGSNAMNEQLESCKLTLKELSFIFLDELTTQHLAVGIEEQPLPIDSLRLTTCCRALNLVLAVSPDLLPPLPEAKSLLQAMLGRILNVPVKIKVCRCFVSSGLLCLVVKILQQYGTQDDEVTLLVAQLTQHLTASQQANNALCAVPDFLSILRDVCQHSTDSLHNKDITTAICQAACEICRGNGGYDSRVAALCNAGWADLLVTYLKVFRETNEETVVKDICACIDCMLTANPTASVVAFHSAGAEQALKETCKIHFHLGNIHQYCKESLKTLQEQSN